MYSSSVKETDRTQRQEKAEENWYQIFPMHEKQNEDDPSQWRSALVQNSTQVTKYNRYLENVKEYNVWNTSKAYEKCMQTRYIIEIFVLHCCIHWTTLLLTIYTLLLVTCYRASSFLIQVVNWRCLVENIEGTLFIYIICM